MSKLKINFSRFWKVHWDTRDTIISRLESWLFLSSRAALLSLVSASKSKLTSELTTSNSPTNIPTVMFPPFPLIVLSRAAAVDRTSLRTNTTLLVSDTQRHRRVTPWAGARADSLSEGRSLNLIPVWASSSAKMPGKHHRRSRTILEERSRNDGSLGLQLGKISPYCPLVDRCWQRMFQLYWPHRRCRI